MPVKKSKLFANKALRLKSGLFNIFGFLNPLKKSTAYRAEEESNLEKTLFDAGLRYDTKAESAALNTVLGDLDEDANNQNAIRTVETLNNEPKGAVVKFNGKVVQIRDKEILDLSFENSIKTGTPQKPYWSLYNLYNLFFKTGGKLKNKTGTRLAYDLETSKDFANMKYVRENLQANWVDYLDKQNEIVKDKALIHYYNESFLTTASKGKGDFIFNNLQAKRLIFLNTTKQPLLYVKKDISTLFPDNATIQYREQFGKYNNKILTLNELSKSHFFFDKYLEIRKVTSRTYIIEPVQLQPLAKDGYLDTIGGKLYLNASPKDFPNLPLKKENDNISSLNLTSPNAIEALTILKSCKNIYPLNNGAITYYFVVTQPGELTAIMLTTVVGELKILGKVNIDSSITPQSVFPVKNYGQFKNPNESLISFYKSDKLYIVSTSINGVSIRDASQEEAQFKSIYSVQTNTGKVLFLNIRFQNTGCKNPIVADSQSIFSDDNYIFGSIETYIGKNFNQRNAVLKSLNNGEIYVTSYDGQIVTYEISSQKISKRSIPNLQFTMHGHTFATMNANGTYTASVGYSQIQDLQSSFLVSYTGDTFEILFYSGTYGFKVFINPTQAYSVPTYSYYMGWISINDTSLNKNVFLIGNMVKFSSDPPYSVNLKIDYGRDGWGRLTQTSANNYTKSTIYNFGILNIIRSDYISNSDKIFVYPSDGTGKIINDTNFHYNGEETITAVTTSCNCSISRQYGGIIVHDAGGFV